MLNRLGKFIAAKGMKIMPNFVGVAKSTAETSVVEEGFTLGGVILAPSTDAEQAVNDNLVISQTPSAATIADYEAPVELTVRTFSFTPFTVFNFTPPPPTFQFFSVFAFFSVFEFFSVFNFFSVFEFFSVFNFFSVFGFFSVFSFFSVFGFSPFRVFGFSPVSVPKFTVFGFSPVYVARP